MGPPPDRAARCSAWAWPPPKPGREELAHRHNVRTIRQATWPRSVRIAVTNPKGGSGKTPTAVILGGLLASIRGGSVAIWDAADAAGTLGGRTEGHRRPVRVRHRRRPRRLRRAEHGRDGRRHPDLVRRRPRARCGNGNSPGRQHRPGHCDVLDRTYRISVADTGNVPHSAAFTGVIAAGRHPRRPDHADRGLGEQGRRRCSAGCRTRPPGWRSRRWSRCCTPAARRPPAWPAQISGIFAKAGVGAVVDIPFDPHIAAGTADQHRRRCPTRRGWRGPGWPPTTVANLTIT